MDESNHEPISIDSHKQTLITCVSNCFVAGAFTGASLGCNISSFLVGALAGAVIGFGLCTGLCIYDQIQNCCAGRSSNQEPLLD